MIMNENQYNNNNNEKKESKTVEREKKSIIPTLLACAACIAVFIVFRARNMYTIVFAGVAAMIVYQITKNMFPPKKIKSDIYDSDIADDKIVEVEKKSAVPILSVGITWAVVLAFFGKVGVFAIAIAAIASYVVYQIAKKKFPGEKVQIHIENELKNKSKESADSNDSDSSEETVTVDSELKELIDKIDVYLIEIKLLNDSIEDEAVSVELSEIEKIMLKIQSQLKDETKANKRTGQLDQFFEYYMPTVVKILNSFRRIETHELSGDNATETKKRVAEALPFIKRAFEKELDYMFTDEMLDITTDIDVLESMLSKDGLIDKNSIK